MKLKTYLILSITALIIGALFYLYITLNKTKKELEKAKVEAKYNYQNFQAYKDSSTMMAKTLQEYAITIKDLSRENKNLKDQNIYLRTQFRILLDSIEILNKPAIVDTSNTDSNKIVITFEGKEGRIQYKGQVIYFKLTEEATHSLKINQDPIKIESIFLFNTETNVITNKIYADGVLIDDAYTEIDSSLYIKLNSPVGVVDVAMNFWDSITLIVEANQEIIYKKDIEQWKQNRTSVNVGLGYNLTRNLSFEVKKDLLNDIWTGNVRFSITPYRLWNTIFKKNYL